MKFGLIVSKQHLPGVSMVERFREYIEQVRAARDAAAGTTTERAWLLSVGLSVRP